MALAGLDKISCTEVSSLGVWIWQTGVHLVQAVMSPK